MPVRAGRPGGISLRQQSGCRARVLPTGLAEALDLRRTGMFGYSAGGFTAAGGDARRSADQGGRESRRHAAVRLPRGRTERVGQAWAGSPVPIVRGRWALASARWAFERPGRASGNQRGWKLDLSIPAGTHGAFADYRSRSGDRRRVRPAQGEGHRIPWHRDPAGSIRAQRAYLAAFFTRFLRGPPPAPPEPPLAQKPPRWSSPARFPRCVA